MIAEQSEAQTGCPVTFTYTKDTVRDLIEPPGFKVDDIRIDHVFPYRVKDYVEYRYEKRFPFRVMPAPMMRKLETSVGWHLMVDATAA